jgi:hypothetical protein
MVANTNLPLGCYVGILYQKSVKSTFNKTICAPMVNTATPANPPYVSAAFCQVSIFLKIIYKIDFKIYKINEIIGLILL